MHCHSTANAVYRLDNLSQQFHAKRLIVHAPIADNLAPSCCRRLFTCNYREFAVSYTTTPAFYEVSRSRQPRASMKHARQ